MNEPAPVPVPAAAFAVRRRSRRSCPEVVVVGAGPHALTCVLSLLHADRSLAGRILVADPEPWLSAWQRRFRRLDLRLLRSSCVHHPHPEPYALLDAARHQGRDDELVGPIGRPTAALFADFCARLVEQEDLEAARTPARVTGLRPREDGRVDVDLDGEQMRVAHVVLANNPARPAVPPLGVLHADGVDLGETTVTGRHVCVVGGGLTAVHLALRAHERGAVVTLLSRAPLRPRPTDVDPVWLGHALPAWFRLGSPARAAAVLRARRGTAPAEALDALARAGVRRVVAPDGVAGVDRVEGRFRVRTQGATDLAADSVWLATGQAFDARFDPLTAGLLDRVPLPLVDGLPVLDDDLSWAGTAVHLTGGLAALQVGPAARNLAGARIAAERMVACVAGVEPARRQYPVPPPPGPERQVALTPAG